MPKVLHTNNTGKEVRMIVGIWGNDKTGKSSLALSFPKPMLYMEFDLGGFERAKQGRPQIRKDFEEGLITYKTYMVPLQGIPDNVTFKPSKVITGMKEFWYSFLQDYIGFLDAKNGIVTGIIDTGTLLWETIATAFLQEKQEQQLDAHGNLIDTRKELRTSLLPIEYREPNIRMRGLLYQARVHNKNLILTHHSRDVYASRPNPRTGAFEEVKTDQKERAGFASLGDSTDWMLHTYMEGGVFKCKVCEESVPPTLVGTVIDNPTYDKIKLMVDKVNGA